MAVLVVVGSTGSVGGAQQAVVPSFRSDVALAVHSVAVLDADGNPVRDLTASDFRVYEEDVRQEISFFLAPDDAPLDVALVMDSSTSLFHWAKIARRAAKTFITRLGVRDCVYMLPFNEEVGPGYWGKVLDPQTGRRIDAIRMEGGTALYDALAVAIQTIHGGARPADLEAGRVDPSEGEGPPRAPRDDAQAGGAAGSDGSAELPADLRLTAAELRLQVNDATRSLPTTTVGAPVSCGAAGAAVDESGRLHRRRAVVLLTDGADEDSVTRFDEVLDAARLEGTPIFPVVLGTADRDERLGKVLDALADNTGGTVVRSTAPQALLAAYDDVVNLLRASYLVGYEPPRDDVETAPKWRAISVRSTRPSYRLVKRDGYYR